MRAVQLARRLGLDRNPLRRRSDKIAACLAAVLIAVFLVGAPLLSAAAAGWAGRAAAAEQQAARSWRQVPAVLEQAAVPPATELSGPSWVRARWTAPNGRARAGEISVNGSLPAGRTVLLWVNAAGLSTGPPPSRRLVGASEGTAVVGVVAALGAVLLCLACAGRWVLDRRRLAEWESGWAAVGPQWTRRFRSRG